MSEKDQIQAFADAIDNLVENYRSEFDMTYAAAVGVLQMKIHLLCEEAGERSDED